MALRNLENVVYIPLLGLRPAEMQALEELPDRDKDLLLPFFYLGPWSSAHQLSSSLSRIEEAYGDRPCFVGIGDAEPTVNERPVHRQLDTLREHSGGYSAWCSFIEAHNNFIPGLQIGQVAELPAQAARMHALGRGLIVLLEQPAFSAVDSLASRLAPITAGGSGVCVLLDYGRFNRDMLGLQYQTIGYAETILRILPNAHVAASASSFPDSFIGVDHQEIFERAYFSGMRSRFGRRLIYSDRGSARAERRLGGGGTPPAPRIDYPQQAEWRFFRSDLTGPEGYFQQAQAAMRSLSWDPNLRIWGTQMIERTALSDTSAIISPKRSTAARINIHLHRQLFYDDPGEMYDTDDQWVD